jgi:leucyl aminopeptidase
MLDIAFAKPALPKSGALVLLIHEGETPSALWAQLDETTGGAIARALEVAEFKGGKGKSCTILAPGANLTRVLAVGLGKPADMTQRNLEEAGGAIIIALARETAVTVASSALSAQQAAEVALGAVLRSYRFDRYRTKEKPEDKPKLSKLTMLTAEVPKAKAAWEPLEATAKGVFITRDLVSEPPNVLDPPEMAERCRKLSEVGLKVEILGPKEMAKLGFGALLGVSQGSVKEPRMVVLHWNGASGNARKLKDKPVVFVGKGVTFDTGGISIKPAGGMEDMKWDMAGAGTVIGLMAALAGRKAKVDAIGLVGLVENMPSGSAQRPGDVVTSYSGQTIEVINTDAEGRLVLADVIWYAQQKYDPKFMVDLATLTGAIIIGLGHEYAGLFSNDDALSQNLTAAGQATGERVWRMPLDEA